METTEERFVANSEFWHLPTKWKDQFKVEIVANENGIFANGARAEVFFNSIVLKFTLTEHKEGYRPKQCFNLYDDYYPLSNSEKIKVLYEKLKPFIKQ